MGPFQFQGFLVLNWGILGAEKVWNWGGVLNLGIFSVELRDFGGWKGVALVWN